MLGSLADTGLDLIASLVTLFGVRVAAMPADHDHRFGHGKAEALAALVQVVLIVDLGARHRLARGRAADRRRRAPPVPSRASPSRSSRSSPRSALLAYQRSVIRRTGSVAIRTDNVHYQSDLLLNLAVIAALALDQYLGFAGADPLFGLAIAAVAAAGAPGAPRSHAVDQLMDREWPEEKRLRFLARRRPPSRGQGHPRSAHPQQRRPRFRPVPHLGRSRR